MARTFTLSDGTTTVNLLNATGAQAVSLGASQFPIDSSLPPGHIRVSENFTLNLYSSDQDHSASQLQSLFKLLRKAHLYHTTSWQNQPVYITAQAQAESNARYALVYGSPNFTMPDVFDIPFETSHFLEGWDMAIIRGVWRSGIPGATPTAATLSKTSAPNNAAIMPVANYFDGIGITSIFNLSSDGTTFSADLSGAQAVTLYGSTYDSDFDLYVGSSDGPFHNICFTLSQDREGGTEVITTFTTDAWVAFTTNMGLGVQSKSSDFITATDGLLGFRAVSIRSAQDAAYTTRAWTQTAINSKTANWVKLEPDTTPTTNAPAITSTDGIYIQNKPYIELSSDILKGDIPPMVNIRMWNTGQHPDNGSSNARAQNVSKIIIGAKSNPGSFASHLNCSGSGLPSTDWTVSYDTDTTGSAASTNADPNTPSGYYAACTFAATERVARVTFAGTNLLDAYSPGKYNAYLRVQQIGGTDGDISVALQTRLGSTNAQMPARLGKIVDLSTHDNGYEIVDLGTFSLPYHETADTDYTDADIIFEVHAKQNVGGVTCNFADLILIPVDEWSIVLDDPISDNSAGTSALWGNQYIEYDSGVLGHKAGKYMLEAGTATAFPAESWFYGGEPFNVEPGNLVRLYFLMGHYNSTLGWGTGPLVSDPSSLLAVQIRPQALYLGLRGAD